MGKALQRPTRASLEREAMPANTRTDKVVPTVNYSGEVSDE